MTAARTSAPAAPDSKAPPPLTSIQDFLFGAPLYTRYVLWTRSSCACDMFVSDLVVDGHCPYCQAASTFHRTEGELHYSDYEIVTRHQRDRLFVITCTRNKEHKIFFVFRFDDPFVQKIGQYPSLADIANDESRLYRQVLEKEDAAELHRAIGLAAHGVGVGSFVYIRRVFER
jgi:hypothetical protein